MRISDWSSDVCSSDLLDSDGIITALGDGSTYIFARRGSVAAATVLTVGSPTTYTEYSTSAYGVDAYPAAVTILAAGGERQLVTRPAPVDAVSADGPDSGPKNGRAACRGRVGQFVTISDCDPIIK